MGRRYLFEFEDQPWFPHILREYMTDYLAVVTSLSAPLFEGFAKRLRLALIQHQEHRIIDLCSGGGGPLPVIADMFARAHYPLDITLTDRYPNIKTFKKICGRRKNFSYISSPIDATMVPDELLGFRTIFNGFHHFRPEDARKILHDAASKKQGIAIMEIVGKTPFSFLTIAMTPALVALSTPFIRPFRLSRWLLTYGLPLVPIFALWDGLVSCLRVYSVEELRQMTETIDASYHWEIGSLPIVGGSGAITYLIGSRSKLAPLEHQDS